MNTLMLRTRLNMNIDAGAVVLAPLAVGSSIEWEFDPERLAELRDRCAQAEYARLNAPAQTTRRSVAS